MKKNVELIVNGLVEVLWEISNCTDQELIPFGLQFDEAQALMQELHTRYAKITRDIPKP